MIDTLAFGADPSEDVELAACRRPHRMNDTAIVHQGEAGRSGFELRQLQMQACEVFRADLFNDIPVATDQFRRRHRDAQVRSATGGTALAAYEFSALHRFAADALTHASVGDAVPIEQQCQPISACFVGGEPPQPGGWRVSFCLRYCAVSGGPEDDGVSVAFPASLRAGSASSWK